MQLLNEGNPSTSPTEKWQVQDTRYARHVCKAVQSVREEPYIGRVYVGKVPAAAAAKSLQSCPTLCDPRDGSPLGSSVPGILQAGTLEWVAISFSNAWKQKVKVKSLSCVRLFAIPWTAAHQAPPPMGFSRLEYWSGVPLPSPVGKVRNSSCLRTTPGIAETCREVTCGHKSEPLHNWMFPLCVSALQLSTVKLNPECWLEATEKSLIFWMILLTKFFLCKAKKGTGFW